MENKKAIKLFNFNSIHSHSNFAKHCYLAGIYFYKHQPDITFLYLIFSWLKAAHSKKYNRKTMRKKKSQNRKLCVKRITNTKSLPASIFIFRVDILPQFFDCSTIASLSLSTHCLRTRGRVRAGSEQLIFNCYYWPWRHRDEGINFVTTSVACCAGFTTFRLLLTNAVTTGRKLN